MSPDLRERLADLAGEAPAPAPYPDLWRRGRRRLVRQRLATGAALVVALGCLSGLVGLGLVARQAPPPASDRTAAGLPDRFFTPSPWLSGTDGHPIGPLIALFGASRDSWHGLSQGSRSALVAVSATTGEYRFLDLPGSAENGAVAQAAVPGASLSPDGAHVGYWLGGPTKDSAGRETTGVIGYAVYDTRSGAVTRFRVDTTFGLAPTGIAWLRGEAWFQYGRYTQVTASSSAFAGSSTEAVDLADGSRRSVTRGAPAGLDQGFGDGEGLAVVDRRHVRLVSSPQGAGRLLNVSRALASAYLSPDGTRLAGFPAAGKCCSERSVLVGSVGRRTPDVVLGAVPRTPALRVLGWRDEDHVVVLRGDGRVQSLDVTTGAAVPLSDISAATGWDPGAQLATGLLTAPVVAGRQPPNAADPRAVAALWLVGLGGVGGLGLLWVRRRRGRA